MALLPPSDQQKNEAIEDNFTNMVIGSSPTAISAFGSDSDLVQAFFDCYKNHQSEFHEFLGTQTVFLTSQFREVVRLVARTLYILCVKHQPIGNGLNRLLTGVRGVGKSTLMKFLYLCVCYVLKESATPFYLDFDKTRVLPTMKIECCFLHEQRITDPDELARALFRQKRPLIIFGDEIQALYFPNASEHHVGLLAVRELYAFGKNGCCFSMLSGSSATTAALAFKEFPRIGKNSLEYHDYPNLNSTVYRDYRIHPLRTREEVSKLVALYGFDSDETRLENLFIYSGGILRNMIAWLNSPEYPSDEAKKNLMRVLEKDLELARVFLTLSLDQKQTIWDCISMVQPDDIPQEQIYAWIEQSWIYKSDHKIEMLFPWHAIFLKEIREQSFGMTNEVYLSFYLLLRKAKGGTPGSCVEEYIRDHMVPFRSLLPITIDRVCEFPKEPIAREKLCGYLFFLKKEQGIDLFALEWSGSQILVHAAQVKVGALGSSIPHHKMGNNKLTVPGILSNFRDGSGKLETILNKRYPKIPIVFATFSLITTKLLDTNGHEMLAKECVDHRNQRVEGLFRNILEFLPEGLRKAGK